MRDSDGPADMAAYRRARQERADQALICLFADVLGAPLTRRELTPDQQARRDARRDEIRLRRAEARRDLSS